MLTLDAPAEIDAKEDIGRQSRFSPQFGGHHRNIVITFGMEN